MIIMLVMRWMFMGVRIEQEGLMSSESLFLNTGDAAALAENAAQLQPVYCDLIDMRRTPLLYEFVRTSATQPEVVQLLRIYACDYLQPGAPERITRRPLTAAVVRHVSEYDWWLSPANNHGTAIMESAVETQPSQFEVSFREARLVAGAGGCDIVEVWMDRRTVARDTAEIVRQRTLERSFHAQFDAGFVTLC